MQAKPETGSVLAHWNLSQMEQEVAGTGAVSKKSTWDAYHRDKTQIQPNLKVYIDRFMNLLDEHRQPGPCRIFELGCGGSQFLKASARRGWTVGGIDYHQESIDKTRKSLAASAPTEPELYCDDIFAFDWKSIEESFDVICSFGFLEHFKDAEKIIKLANVALKPGGLVLSQIPNLHLLNAGLMKKYDPELWSQHVPYDKKEFDHIHEAAGLEILMAAEYRGKYDKHMLTPWAAIRNQMSSFRYNLLNYSMSAFGRPARVLLPAKGMKRFSPSVVGIYRKP
ncbi:MAG: class I SAM-dependent methyltransferase [Woeseia sp.]|nr:class I SAM-dependent methyltransferase [Woeseia sp.]